MRTIFCSIILIICIFCNESCNNKLHNINPILVSKLDTITNEKLYTIAFKNIKSKNWNCYILSSLQPILLQPKLISDSLLLAINLNNGFTQGNATFVLNNAINYYYYPIYLKYHTQLYNWKTKNYRSPKTVNPDSALAQQQIIFAVDNQRNIRKFNNNEYFYCNNLQLPTIANTYKIDSSNLKNIYVQAGSPNNLPIQFLKNIQQNNFQIIVGPIYDKWNNTIADGTLVSFIYKKNNTTSFIESSTIKGFTRFKIKNINKNNIIGYAKCNELKSSTINLNPF